MGLSSDTLLIIALAWGGLGVACVAAIEYAARSSRTKGPLSQDKLQSSVGYVIGLVIGAPFIMVFALIQLPLILWRGTIPITGKHWWPARAKKFGATLVEESDESTLCKMIELRRKVDPALRGQPHPSNMPVYQLWRTPEYIIYFVCRCAALLQHDGYSEAEEDPNTCLIKVRQFAEFLAQQLAARSPARHPLPTLVRTRTRHLGDRIGRP